MSNLEKIKRITDEAVFCTCVKLWNRKVVFLLTIKQMIDLANDVFNRLNEISFIKGLIKELSND